MSAPAGKEGDSGATAGDARTESATTVAMRRIAKPKRALPLRDQVFDGIIHGLSVGTFRSGDRLTEAGVATALGVSRTPVREALGLLAQRGILARRSYGGFVVVTPSQKMLKDIYEIRKLLEPSTAGRIAASITPAELSELREALLRLRKVAGKRSDQNLMRAIGEFRRRIYRLSDNDALEKAIDIANGYYQVQFVMMLALASSAIRKRMLAHLTEVFTAIESRNVRAAERAVHRNLDAWYEAISAAMSRFEPNSVSVVRELREPQMG